VKLVGCSEVVKSPIFSQFAPVVKVRFKVPPNPEGKGLIDVNALVAAELEIPLNLPMLSDTPFYTGDYLATNVYILAGDWRVLVIAIILLGVLFAPERPGYVSELHLFSTQSS